MKKVRIAVITISVLLSIMIIVGLNSCKSTEFNNTTAGTLSSSELTNNTTPETISPSETNETTLYFRPFDEYKSHGARFAAYLWTDEPYSTIWMDMTDMDGDGTYECSVLEAYSNVIFCRMDPSTVENNWDNKWNQTGDLVIAEGKNCYTMTNGVWDGDTAGTWTVYKNTSGNNTNSSINPGVTTSMPGLYHNGGLVKSWSDLLSEDILLLEDGTITGCNIEALDTYNEGNVYSLIIADNTVTAIEAFAFVDCAFLQDITIPDSVINIGIHAFQGCTNLKQVVFGDGIQLTTINYGTFAYCPSLESISIPTSVAIIDSWAFAYCDKLANITIPEGVVSVGKQAFGSCNSLVNITIPASLQMIDDYTFSWCINLKNVTFAEDSHLETIGIWTFYFCESLTSITIPDSVTTIGTEAFYECASLKSVVIGKSVTTIEDRAFAYCPVLQSITFTGSQNDWRAISLGTQWNHSASATNVTCSDGTISLK